MFPDTKIVQAERKSKRSLRFCRGAAYLGGASARKACKPSAKANEVCGFAEVPPVWAGLRPAKRASRAQKQTKFAVLPRCRLSGQGLGPHEAPCGRRGHPNGGRDTNAPVSLGTPWGAGVRLLSLVVSSVPGRRCAARRLFFANFPFSFCAFGKKSYFCTRVSLIRPAPVESPRQGIEQGYTVVAVRYK